MTSISHSLEINAKLFTTNIVIGLHSHQELKAK